MGELMETPAQPVEQGTIYYCRGCGKVGESSADLLRQGCEGMHDPYILASSLTTANQQIEELTEQLEKVARHFLIGSDHAS